MSDENGPVANDRILDLRRGAQALPKAHHLTEYDAIVLEPSWIVGQLPGGMADAMSIDHYEYVAGDLRQRSSQLSDFFNNRGLLVVALEEPAHLTLQEFQAPAISSYDWWMTSLGLSWQVSADTGLFLMPGSGQVGLVTDPNHSFGPYLELNRGFSVRLNDRVADDENVSILAESRVKNAVAVEVTVLSGAAVLVPPPQSPQYRDLLYSATEEVLHARGAGDSRWKLGIEATLEGELAQALAQMRVIRSNADDRLRRVREVKRRVLQLPHVARAVRFYETAIQGAPTPAKSLPNLYKLVETVEYRFGGEKQTAEKLGISVSAFKRIKRLANDPEFAIRHAPEIAISEVKSKELHQAVEDAAGILLLLIEMEVLAMLEPKSG